MMSIGLRSDEDAAMRPRDGLISASAERAEPKFVGTVRRGVHVQSEKGSAAIVLRWAFGHSDYAARALCADFIEGRIVSALQSRLTPCPDVVPHWS